MRLRRKRHALSMPCDTRSRIQEAECPNYSSKIAGIRLEIYAKPAIVFFESTYQVNKNSPVLRNTCIVFWDLAEMVKNI